MKKTIITLISIVCFLMTACTKDNEPETFGIRFGRQNYTVRNLVSTTISFVDGGGKYEVEIENPAIIENAEIDAENKTLKIIPKTTGESKIKIKDIRADYVVTLNITVTDFYLAYKVMQIFGENYNSYITVDSDIRYIRTADNRNAIQIVAIDGYSGEEKIIAYGGFDITKRNDKFILEMSLHKNENEELELFSYSVEGHYGVFNLFNRYFEFGWTDVEESRDHVETINMDLTDLNNGCTINTILL